MKTTELIKRTCPMCGRVIGLKEDETMAAEHRHYAMYGGRIQDELTDFDAFEREFIKTGYCPNCQEMLFGKRRLRQAGSLTWRQHLSFGRACMGLS